MDKVSDDPKGRLKAFRNRFERTINQAAVWQHGTMVRVGVSVFANLSYFRVFINGLNCAL